MPEIDGLRFIAIFLVAFLMHIGTLLQSAQLGIDADRNTVFFSLIWEGGYGVQIFFMISGFILSLPFGQEKLLNQGKVTLKNYYRKRLTRIEPPYIICLILYFILRVFFLHYSSFKELLPHFFASLFYVHNIVYQSSSAVNGVAWTLEIEVQFYLLAPILTSIYYLKNIILRRSVFAFLIISSTILFSKSEFTYPVTLIDKLNFFMCGMLLADLYLLRKNGSDGWITAILAIAVFFIYLFVPTIEYENVYLCCLKIVAMALFFYTAITNRQLKQILSIKVITVIGGMCYSIYLLHMGIYGIMRHKFFTIKFFGNSQLNIAIHYCLAVIIVLIISGAFFLLVEKPTMRKDWHKGIFKKNRGVTYNPQS